jgi:hypothetical protein
MRNLTLERTTLLITIALLLAIAIRVPVDTDTWWHLRSGEYTLTQGMIYTDPFSHTFAGEPWINHSWGAQVVLLMVWRVAGNIGLSLYTAILAVGGMVVLLPVMRGSAILKAFLLVLGASAAAVFWSARPQMVSFFLSAVFLAELYRYRANPSRRIWVLVPLMALWANLHAGYSIGFIFLGAFIVGQVFNRLFVLSAELTNCQILMLVGVAVACVVALVLTPYGLNTLLVPFQTVSIGSLRDFIQEWNSPNFQGRETWPFIAMIAVAVGGAWASRLRWDWTGFFLFGGTLFMALLYGRNIAVFAVAVLPQLSYWFSDVMESRGWLQRRPRPNPRAGRINAVLVGVVALCVLVYALGAVWSPNVMDKAQRDYLPVGVAEYLNREQPTGNLFNSYNWGGYLMFAAPQYPVFIDGRTDLYGDFLRTYLNVTNAADNWREVLDQTNVNTVAVELGTGLDTALAQDAAWSEVYRDDKAIMYTREDMP